MKKLATVAGLMMLALVIGVTGTSFRPDKAQAKPTDVIAFNPDVCAAMTHSGTAFCYSLNDSADLAALAEVLDGAVDDPATYQDLVDASAAQLGDDSQILVPNSQSMWVLSFVGNDDLLTLTADEGVWLSTANPGPAKSTTTACPFADEDCDANGTKGDGVVVDLLYSGVPAADTDSSDFLDRGDATLTVTQSGIDTDMDYTVVGAPDDMTLTALKDTIQEDSGAPCVVGGYTTNEFTQENALADVSGLLAKVVDDDATELTGIWVAWESSDTSDIDLAKDVRTIDGNGNPLGITVFKSTQAYAPNLACGVDTGSSAVQAAVDNNADGLIETHAIDDSVDITVIGKPTAMTVTANPTSMVCDGLNSSTVSATLTNSNGDLVADGTSVHFAVQGPAVVNPVSASTVGGVASTTVTGLSGITLMLPVSATSGDLEAQLGVDCIASTPQPTGDVNCDGKVSMVDAMLIAQKVAGLITEFPACGPPPTPAPTP